MIRLAVSNLAWTKENDIRMYQVLSDLGFAGVEIAPGRLWDPPYGSIDEAGEWAEMLKKEYGLMIPSMQSIWYGRTENLFRSEEDRRILLDHTVRAMELAERISCRNLVFGCPKNRNIETRRSSTETANTAACFFGELGRRARKHGVVLGIEANPVIYHTNYLNTTRDAAMLVKNDRTGGLRLNLDLGTMIYDREPLEMIRKMVPLISHVHISEPGLVPIQKRPEHRELFRILYEEHYEHFVSIEMGRCEDLETVMTVMEYVKEVCRDAEP